MESVKQHRLLQSIGYSQSNDKTLLLETILTCTIEHGEVELVSGLNLHLCYLLMVL